MSGRTIVDRFARPDTRLMTPATAYAGGRVDERRDDAGRQESWMGALAGWPAERSHPGFDVAIHAKGWEARMDRTGHLGHAGSISFEEDAGPATPLLQTPDTEKARCANTGPLRSVLDWMSPGSRLDRRQTA